MNLTDAEALDRADPLARHRDDFALPDGIIYLDGNSLGALPKAVVARIAKVVGEEWGQGLITSWNRYDWIDLPRRVGEKIAPLIGAAPGTVVVADSTSVNIFKLLSVALAVRPDRKVIVTEEGNFPTDVYMAGGLASLLGQGHQMRLAAAASLADAIREDTAVVLLTEVNYRTGAKLDMRALTERAHEAGALIIWDLCHSAGAIPVDLTGANADFAVGCGYKFLNGGPGAPAFLFAARRHHAAMRPVLSGWFGHAAPFAFEHAWRPAEGIVKMAVGTPAILSLAALEAGVDLMLEASMDALRTKSLKQAEIFAALMEQELRGHGFRAASPTDAAQRGSQLCYDHENGWPIMRALISRKVIGDYRAPGILRFGFTPLYLGYTELWDAISILRDVMESRSWDKPEHHARARVT